VGDVLGLIASLIVSHGDLIIAAAALVAEVVVGAFLVAWALICEGRPEEKCPMSRANRQRVRPVF